MRKILVLILAAALLLSGCSWMDGSYYSVTPHEEHDRAGLDETVSASNYRQLRMALEDMVRAGRESCVINVADFAHDQVGQSMATAVRYIRETFPLGAYAVESIRYELGASSGRPAIAVEIDYRRSDVELRNVLRVSDMASALEAISQNLAGHEEGVVLLVEAYQQMDIAQLVESYCLDNPDKVMEIPQVVTGVYPDVGVSRVIEVQFTYQNSREALRQMREQTELLFTSAEMYVSADADDRMKFSQLYTFLMERFDYQLDTSITPAYSLLRHGVGDSRAFATVYAAMCRRVGLECHVVTGTRAGEPWYWNIVMDEGLYFHVDLLRSSFQGGFDEQLDGEMIGYVWDYSGYPVCDQRKPLTETVEETTEATEPEENPA